MRKPEIAVLVIRAWVDKDKPAGSLRARITQTPNISTQQQREHHATAENEILAIVDDWLHAFLGSSPPRHRA